LLEYNDTLTIGDVIRYIASDHERTCILTTSGKKLYGVISQGDLIKAFWNGAELISPISNFINPNPISINSDTTNKVNDAINLFCEFGTLLIPVIDKDRIIKEVLSVRKILSDNHGK